MAGSKMALLLVALVVMATGLPQVVGKKGKVPQGVNLSFPPFDSRLNCSVDGSVTLETRFICTPSTPPGDRVFFSDDLEVISVRYQYNDKVRLYSKRSHLAASFSTSFTIDFSREIEATVRRVFGGGFAFAITPNQSVGASGRESLGLFPIDTATGLPLGGGDSRVVAVELDTSREFDWDPAIPHLGLDINSLRSVVAKSLGDGSKLIDHKLGVYIDYDAVNQLLEVRMHKVVEKKNPSKKKAKLLISFPGFILSDHVDEWSYVGFSARVPQTEQGVYILSDWKFTTTWVRTAKYHV